MIGFREFKDRLIHYDAEVEARTKTCFKFYAVMLILAVIVFVAATFYEVCRGEVGKDYFAYADAIFRGAIPFHPFNDLNWEYPPLSYLVIMIPRFFTSDVEGYIGVYMVFVTSVIILGLWLIRSFAMKRGRNASLMMGLYTICAMLTIQFFCERFDVFVGVLALLAIAMFFDGRKKTAFLLLSIGMMVKLYPGLLFPVFLIPLLASRKYKDVLVGSGVFIGAAAVMMVPFVLMSPDNFLAFISYHNNRGLQIESVFASFIMIAEQLGLTFTYTVNKLNTLNIFGGPSDALAGVAFPLTIIALLAFMVFYFLRCRTMAPEETEAVVTKAALIIILIFVLLNKVFSAQYMVWILMLAIPAMCCMETERAKAPMLLMFGAFVSTTGFELLYMGLCYHDICAVILLFMRNILLLAMFVELLDFRKIYAVLKKQATASG